MGATTLLIPEINRALPKQHSLHLYRLISPALLTLHLLTLFRILLTFLNLLTSDNLRPDTSLTLLHHISINLPIFRAVLSSLAPLNSNRFTRILQTFLTLLNDSTSSLRFPPTLEVLTIFLHRHHTTLAITRSRNTTCMDRSLRRRTATRIIINHPIINNSNSSPLRKTTESMLNTSLLLPLQTTSIITVRTRKVYLVLFKTVHHRRCILQLLRSLVNPSTITTLLLTPRAASTLNLNKIGDLHNLSTEEEEEVRTEISMLKSTANKATNPSPSPSVL